MSEVTIRKYKSGDLPEMIAVWNEVVALAQHLTDELQLAAATFHLNTLGELNSRAQLLQGKRGRNRHTR